MKIGAVIRVPTSRVCPDLPGFSNEEQQLLAAVVQNHRRKPDPGLLAALPLRWRLPAQRITALLRLAVLLCRSRQDPVSTPRTITARANTLRLGISANRRRGHPLTFADLETEQTLLQELGMKLTLAH